jgi:hypothetical protein
LSHVLAIGVFIDLKYVHGLGLLVILVLNDSHRLANGKWLNLHGNVAVHFIEVENLYFIDEGKPNAPLFPLFHQLSN